MTKAALDKILTEMGYEEDEKYAVKEIVVTLRRMKTITKEALKESGKLSAGIVDELMVLQEWYEEWSSSMTTASQPIEDVFTETLWDEYLMKRADKKKKSGNIIKQEASDPHAKTVSNSDALNVSYKVETKEIPKLPANKTLKGKIFDDWVSIFYVKMCQAKVYDILA